MPLQNRVRPDGEIVATGQRGLFMGNRGGRRHDDRRRLETRRWASNAWICCRTSFNDRQRQVMGSGYTELFFLDEATALAAGHRPCFECRHQDAVLFAEAWNAVRGLTGRARAADMDDILHAQRLLPDGGKRLHTIASSDVPDGVFVLATGISKLCYGGRLWFWTEAGYATPMPAAAGWVEALTPPAIIAVLGAGYRPVLHGSLSGRVA